VAVLATLIAVAGSAPAQASAGRSSVILAASKASLDRQTTVRVSVVSRLVKKFTGSVVADLGTNTGREVIDSGHVKVKVLLTTKMSYISGNEAGLESFVGLPGPTAAKIGPNWITAPARSTMYAYVARSLNVIAVRSVTPPAKGVTMSRVTVAGEPAYRFTWIAKASGTTPITSKSIYLTTSGGYLPIEEVLQNVNGTTTTSFSRWGEKISFHLPNKHTLVPYARIP
jgi:hypothetical protein